MAHITLSQLTTVLQRIVSWATGKFAAKNTYSGKIEYADMPVVVLASMGSELDGTSAQRPMSTGSTYYLPAGQGAGARIMFVDSNGTAVKISNPGSNVIYCNAYTGLLYRWDASESDMVPVGGDLDGLRKVYVDNMDFSSLDTLYSGVYQVIDQTTQRIIGVLVASSDNRFGENPYFVTQWLFSNLLLSDEYSGSFNGYYTIGRAHIIHRFYNASNTSSDIPLNTWSEWKVYGLTFDEMSEIFNSKVSTISVNGTNHTPDSSGVVNLGTVITAHQDISGKANASDVYTKTQTDTLLSGKLSKSDVSIETQGDGTVDINVGSGANKDTYTINLNHTHEGMAKLEIVDEEPASPALDTIYALVDDADTPTEIQSLWIAGLEFVGGGGGEPDYTPKLTSPRNGATIDFDGQSTATIVVKGRNITSNLSVAVTGDFTVTANGQSVSTIAAADVTDGASLTLTLTKGNDFSSGSLELSSADLDEDVEVRIIDSSAVVQLAGVKFTGTQWLETDYKANPKTEFILKCRLETNSITNVLDNVNRKNWILGGNDAQGCYELYHISSNGTGGSNPPYNLMFTLNSLTGGTMIASDSTNMLTDPLIIQYNKTTGKLTAGNGSSSVTAKTGSNTGNLRICCRLTNGEDVCYSRFYLTIYEFTIIEDGVNVRHYIPMRRAGVPGLYDEVYGSFLTSKTNYPLVEVIS